MVLLLVRAQELDIVNMEVVEIKENTGCVLRCPLISVRKQDKTTGVMKNNLHVRILTRGVNVRSRTGASVLRSWISTSEKQIHVQPFLWVRQMRRRNNYMIATLMRIQTHWNVFQSNWNFNHEQQIWSNTRLFDICSSLTSSIHWCERSIDSCWALCHWSILFFLLHSYSSILSYSWRLLDGLL